jgi:hypothetical protein
MIKTNLSKNELKQISIVLYTEENKNKKIFTSNELKFVIDSSIIGLFGVLQANKMKYIIKRDENFNFTIKAYEK